MDGYQRLVVKALRSVDEVLPWDLEEEIEQNPGLIVLDIREPDEFEMMHIKGSLHVPRGVLEGACVWNYDDTIPALAKSRDQNIVVVCRSGNRSALAALTMQQMGFKQVRSLKLGIKGWNDNDLEMLNNQGDIVDINQIDEWLNRAVPEDKLKP
ncbi:MAG TPA: sulfurtransferase [Gammaproteobacteria bacterium]|jgi:rhodanese-related sulfurtransferase|uniref:Rhodanese-related sulfurtransferase n=1 Tax=hydrothermal vent metagenome TaxID=652676 RepID=A0A1W1DUT4_9ZZZZ|nr:sulfurtransferase [Gammaproteobacteria bacterium]HAO53666.1 sulfurtransferase [Gammaproteobacteria bacterium]HAO86752.1 sulfurtransferase [Gammaproteobacteria bacterium]HBN57749.1 sulfurtransferase [Gammaproteobacteria bacterium]HBQ23683.1 sulfurtransferase [Gammaproteobacteria bacterium]